MPQVPLTAKTIFQLADGYAEKVIDNELETVNRDIDGGATTARPAR